MKIETERLLIRPWIIEDITYYHNMASDIGYTCFSPPGIFSVKNEEEAAVKVKNRMTLYNEHKIGKFLLFEKSTGAFVGTCGGDFFNLDGQKEVEMGYRIMLGHWGKGFATESGKALINYFLNELLGHWGKGFATESGKALINYFLNELTR
jgi:RimJ/RimL family protein N-acetyltransferase